jgi:hypothetical protein
LLGIQSIVVLTNHYTTDIMTLLSASPRLPQAANAPSPLPRLQIPGPLTVAQGIPGDGMRNSMTEPVPVWREVIRAHEASLGSTTAATTTPPVTPPQNAGEVVTTLPAAALRQLTLTSSPDASPDLHPDLTSALELWREESKSRQVYKYKEWKELCLAHVKASKEQPPATAVSWAHLSSSAWWRCRGQLAVWNALPKNTGQPPKAIAALPPGTVIQACALYAWTPSVDEAPRCLVPATSTEPTVYPWNLQVDQRGQVWIVQITAPVAGYCVYSLDGYPLLLPGDVEDNGLEAWAQPSHWYWKVTCPAGAFLREGLELSTRRVSTLPYGTLVQVLRQCVNEAGLPRLQIVAHVYENASYRRVEGWCSTALNPLSGQRGKILQPFPFVRPVVYRIVLPQGAVIRADVELGSPVVGHCPYGSWVSVNEQQFSDFPAERAVARLRLAGGGWISTRLNHSPPHDLAVVEFVGADQGFDPEKPELFHYHAQRQAVLLQREAESDETQPDQAMVDAADPANASAAAPSRMVATAPSSSISATSALTPHSPGGAASYRRASVLESNANILSKPCLCCGKSVGVVIQCPHTRSPFSPLPDPATQKRTHGTLLWCTAERATLCAAFNARVSFKLKIKLVPSVGWKSIWSSNTTLASCNLKLHD